MQHSNFKMETDSGLGRLCSFRICLVLRRVCLLARVDPIFFLLTGQSYLTLCNPWTVTHQPPLPMGFSRQEYWSGLPFPFSGVFQTQGSNPGLLHCRRFFTIELPGKPRLISSYLMLISAFIIQLNLLPVDYADLYEHLF